jgi:hypothetical protein
MKLLKSKVNSFKLVSSVFDFKRNRKLGRKREYNQFSCVNAGEDSNKHDYYLSSQRSFHVPRGLFTESQNFPVSINPPYPTSIGEFQSQVIHHQQISIKNIGQFVPQKLMVLPSLPVSSLQLPAKTHIAREQCIEILLQIPVLSNL